MYTSTVKPRKEIKNMTSITKKVMSLHTKSTKELKEIYQSVFKEPAPFYASGVHLIPKIAYRMQELAMGGLSKDTKDKLRKIAQGTDPTSITPSKQKLLPGVKIRKKYKEMIHEVEVKQQGYEYQGQSFNSLSAIATKITGTKWNGPKFFGLR